jgi:microcystin-dependent protein
MTTKDFKVSQGVEIDNYAISPSGAIDGQVLVFNGTDYSPDDIVPVGTIEMWAGSSTPPSGWLLCDGSSYSWAQYTRLRDVIGISYGGSVDTSWNVPDLTSSNDFVTPVGVAAGDSLGASSKLFGSASTFHTHNIGQNYQSNTTNSHAHSHNTSGGGEHGHFLNSSNWNHNHGTNVPSNSHSHAYNRGNTSNNTVNTAHGTHNVSNDAHQHKHTFPTTNPGHSHNTNANAANSHSHNWTMQNTTSLSGDVHTHTVNKQSIYFIIKH